ncbi:MAG: hypothetical protein A3G34_11120 [Candidatus Lindowbacteria bacterium RIFCSPLOWO2_12_FULL_62_27]|nr:MAG: hypothetical protein A3G34_11120 [Candidatus Lindowbacteria bacterium RIFCSPLOWO2_12_FULL_62_27]
MASPKKSPAATGGGIAKDIRDFMHRHRLDELVIEKDREKIEVRLGPAVPLAPAHPAAESRAPAPAALAPTPAPSTNLQIRAPMAGTFYRSSSPNADPYVKEGDAVTPATTVCVIEAMKVMNEIKADVAGKVVKICVENAAQIESGALLFELSPA